MHISTNKLIYDRKIIKIKWKIHLIKKKAGFNRLYCVSYYDKMSYSVLPGYAFSASANVSIAFFRSSIFNT